MCSILTAKVIGAQVIAAGEVLACLAPKPFAYPSQCTEPLAVLLCAAQHIFNSCEAHALDVSAGRASTKRQRLDVQKRCCRTCALFRFCRTSYAGVSHWNMALPPSSLEIGKGLQSNDCSAWGSAGATEQGSHVFPFIIFIPRFLPL